MDGRISLSLFSLLLVCAGCVTTPSQKNVSVTPTPADPPAAQPPTPAKVVKKEDGAKRNPKPATEIAYGQMKEGEADSEAAKRNPELQTRIRDEARVAYQRALKLDPDNLDAYRCLGRLYIKTGELDRAQETLRQAMAKHPKDANLWYDLGVCHNRRKDFGESIRCFQKALEFDPDNREVQKKLGFTLAWVGQVDQGLAQLKRAQGSALAHCNIARVLEQKNDKNLARQFCMQALKENPQLQDARDLLARLDETNPPSAVRAQLSGPSVIE